jgi:hypothetical protein
VTRKRPWEKKAKFEWRDECRSLKDTRSIKQADLGGGQETPFERAFSNLAHAYLADRAPQLLDYEVGFQLIEKSSDNTKACGVCGFKVGDQWLYAPVFFLNGELKGHELLYIKNQDLFVPMKDNWLGYLLGRKPNTLGKTVSRNLSQLGVQPPNLVQLSRSPYKLASAGAKAPRMAEWSLDFLPVMAKLATQRIADDGASLDLPIFLKQAGRPAFEYLVGVIGNLYPAVFKAVDQFYGPDMLTKVAQEIAEKERRAVSQSIVKKAISPPMTRDSGCPASYGVDALDSLKKYQRSWLDGTTGRDPGNDSQSIFKRAMGSMPKGPKEDRDVQVILREDIATGNAKDIILSEKEKTKIITDGKVVRDKRPASAISKVYAHTTSFKLFNPDVTNIYEVLIRPGRFEKCLIVVGPYGSSGHENFCTIISLDSDNRWLNTHPSRVFCASQYSREAWLKWFDTLDDATSLPINYSKRGRDGKLILLSQNGQGTTPLTIKEEIGESGNDEGHVYKANFDDYCRHDNPIIMSQGMRTWRPMSEETASVRYVRLTDRIGAKMRVTSEELWVPAGYKKLIISKGFEKTEADGDFGCCPSSGSSDPMPLQPGDIKDVQMALIDSTVPLSLLSDGATHLHINDHVRTKESAFRELVCRFGMAPDTAELLIKNAAEQPKHCFEYRIKMAGPFLTESQPSAPPYPEPFYGPDPYFAANVPTQVPDERGLMVRDLMADPSAYLKYKPQGPDPQTMQMAQQAASTGQKEVFDTAVLGSLLKSMRQDSMIDRYQGDLLKGMDRKGRIYFQFLWHGEEFEKRYGKQDMPELEDGLRNAFEADGDIVLQLKQKGVEPFAEYGTDVDLGSLAN